jgi:hypothetical protein
MFKLIPDAKISWRFSSVQATLLLGIVSSIQAELFPVLEPLFSPEQWRYVLPLWTVLIYILRNIAQPALEPERQQLELDKAEMQTSPAFDARGQDVDGAIEGMAEALYAASGLAKPWANVSPESKERWRTVAAAALARNNPAKAAEGNA